MAWESARDPICKGKPTLPCDLLQVPVKFVWQFNGLAHCVLLDTALPENRRFRRDSQRPPTAADRVEKTVGQPILAASRLSGGWTGWKAGPRAGKPAPLFHGPSRAEGPSQQTTRTDRLSHYQP